MGRFGLKAGVATMAVAAIVGVGVLTAAGYAGQMLRVSTDSNGVQGNQSSVVPSISRDGRYVAFFSTATNLATADTNSTQDVFRKDRVSNETTLASRGFDGSPANDNSLNPAISQDGASVAFQSAASNLVPGETGMTTDVFVKSFASGETTRVSSSPAGAQGNSASSAPSISSTGALVAFQSLATNLVADDTNAASDVFVKNLTTGQTVRVSTDAGGAEAEGSSRDAAISADGTKVAFTSSASNLVGGDVKGFDDVFVKDLATGAITCASRDAANLEANGNSRYPSISDDGRYVAFESDASNLVAAGDGNGAADVYVKDLQTGEVRRVSHTPAGADPVDQSVSPSISGDGQYISFQSLSADLVSGDTKGFTDVFLWNRATDKIVRISSDSSGAPANGNSGASVMSGLGAFVAFNSSATNLVTGDTNNCLDVFVNEVELRPYATVGAPSKPAAVYTWAPYFTSTGYITQHSGVASVTIECYYGSTKSTPVRYAAVTAVGGTTYKTTVKLWRAGTWYMRAKHEDATHRASYSSWTVVKVTSAPVLSAPKVPTSMYVNHTYTVYGTIKPRHTSSTYIIVKAYKLVGSSYVYKTHFHVRITNTGQPYNTTKYLASVKLTSKGYWKLTAYHTAHGVEGSLLSSYSARFLVK